MSRAELSGITGVLCDLDGTLYVGDTPIEGAADAVRHLRRRGLELRFLTNTTTRSRDTLFGHARGLGLEIRREEILSAAYAGVLHLRTLGSPRCRLLLREDARQDYAEFPIDEKAPDVVVIGDIGNRWDYDLLNSIFRQVLDGAQIVALHRNGFFRAGAGLSLDAGAFIAAIEYAAGTRSFLVGKPAERFFGLALASMDMPAENVIIIGDDIESDIGGGQASGVRGILVKTGKFRQDVVDRSGIIPDYVLDSVGSIRDLW